MLNGLELRRTSKSRAWSPKMKWANLRYYNPTLNQCNLDMTKKGSETNKTKETPNLTKRESMGRSRRRKRQRLVAKAEAEPEQAIAAVARDGGAFPVLPGELILEIVWRVPAKRVLQLRCVCKSWKSLISEPHFMKANLQRSFSDIDASASRAVKVLDAIGSVLNSIEYENLTVVLLDSVIASLEIVRGELRQIKRGVILHQSFLKIYNSQ